MPYGLLSLHCHGDKYGTLAVRIVHGHADCMQFLQKLEYEGARLAEFVFRSAKSHHLIVHNACL